jgi:hypothetical protein
MTFFKKFPTTLLALACFALAAPPATEAAPRKPAKKAVKKARKAKPSKPAIDYTGEFVNFGQWKEVQQFMGDMEQKHGVPVAELEKLFLELRYIDAAVQLVKPAPPGKPKNWLAYRSRFIEPVRVNAGAEFWNANRDTLARAEALYGVPADIIVGIIGVETIYGRDMGKFRVLDVLATLAFAYPLAPNRESRMAFFRSELEATIVSARQTGLDPLTLTGSYAGATARWTCAIRQPTRSAAWPTSWWRMAGSATIRPPWSTPPPCRPSGRGKNTSTMAWTRSSAARTCWRPGSAPTRCCRRDCMAWWTCRTAPSRRNTGLAAITFMLLLSTTGVISMPCRWSNWGAR